jgi:hypothetical protein
MDAKIISDEQVLHRAGEQGERIGRVQVVEVDGVRYTVRFWYDLGTGRLVRVE